MNLKRLAGLAAFIFLLSQPLPAFAKGAAMIEDGSKVKMHFKLMANGELVDSTFEREPMEFTYGTDPLMPGLKDEVKGMKAGDKKSFKLGPEQGFGPHDPRGIVEVPKDRFPQGDLKEGMVVGSKGPDGKPLRAMVKEIKEEVVILDFNHPLAGQELEIEVEILEVAKS